ncbi:MAG: type II secretion system F family protein [Nanopusillaceae archaeon]
MGILDDLFEGITNDYLSAGFKKKLSDYIREAKIYSIGVSISITILVFFLLLLFIMRYKTLPIYVLFLVPLVWVVSFFGMLYFFRIYPKLVKSERQRKIDNSLYYVTLYMAALASSGVNPKVMFELLAKYKEFSEIHKEAKDIIYLVDTVGLSLPLALKYKVEHSPSKRWASILEGIRTMITEGGDLERYLYEQAATLAEEYKRKIIEYSNNLQIFLEIYITLVVVGVIFIIVLTTLMGSIAGGGNIFLLQLMSVLIVMPMATALFVILIKAINPFES